MDNHRNNAADADYEPPELVDLGPVEEATLKAGTRVDGVCSLGPSNVVF